jgi:hypothetical protein
MFSSKITTTCLIAVDAIPEPEPAPETDWLFCIPLEQALRIIRDERTPGRIIRSIAAPWANQGCISFDGAKSGNAS